MRTKKPVGDVAWIRYSPVGNADSVVVQVPSVPKIGMPNTMPTGSATLASLYSCNEYPGSGVLVGSSELIMLPDAWPSFWSWISARSRVWPTDFVTGAETL